MYIINWKSLFGIKDKEDPTFIWGKFRSEDARRSYIEKWAESVGMVNTSKQIADSKKDNLDVYNFNGFDIVFARYKPKCFEPQMSRILLQLIDITAFSGVCHKTITFTQELFINSDMKSDIKRCVLRTICNETEKPKPHINLGKNLNDMFRQNNIKS